MLILGACVATMAAVALYEQPAAHACGCFAPPDPSVPIVQAGERIAFAMEDGDVIAHIQIQYSGDAEEFAWLVPLPSLPEMTLGTDELFTQLIATTQPKYIVNREFEECSLLGEGSAADGSPSSSPTGSDEGPLVSRDTIGPYDYAILKADSKQPMLDWLSSERFFVPAGTEEVVDPYIRPGAYFLALKLRSGESSGDLQPVVLRYRSDLPMIPIVLTSVAADPDMGILVWMLGEHRAIPRNYYHTELNDAALDWLNGAQNYVEVVTRAVDEANRHHSFVTEYAGTSAIMRDVLDPPNRFGDREYMRRLTDPIEFVNYVLYSGYADFPQGFPVISTQLLGVLQRHLPVPAGLLAAGIPATDYYLQLEYYLGSYRQQHPEQFADLDLEYDPAAVTAELEERIVVPTLAAGQLFRKNSYMTRLFTTLSPDEMNRDPVFSYNPDLPDVSNVHTANLVLQCTLDDDGRLRWFGQLITEQGWVIEVPDGIAGGVWPDIDMPASAATQILREEGLPTTVRNNRDSITSAIGAANQEMAHNRRSGGCALAPTGRGASGFAALLLAGLFLGTRRRRTP